MVALVALRHPNRDSSAPATHTVTLSSQPGTPPGSPPGSGPPKSSSSDSRQSSSSSSSSSGLVGALPLVVLNNTHTVNLASDSADIFRHGGWKVTSVDEGYSNNILSTAAYYDPSVSNAKDVAQKLQQQFPAISRVVPKFSPLPDGPIVVILDGPVS